MSRLLPILLVAGLFGSVRAPGAPVLEVTPAVAAFDLPLDGEGHSTTHFLKVADLVISTGNPRGCSLTLSAGSLRPPHGRQPIPFELVVVDAETPPTGRPRLSVSSSAPGTLRLPRAGTTRAALYIRYTPRPLQEPGIYRAEIELRVWDD